MTNTPPDEQGRPPSDHEASDIKRIEKLPLTQEVAAEFAKETNGWTAVFHRWKNRSD